MMRWSGVVLGLWLLSGCVDERSAAEAASTSAAETICETCELGLDDCVDAMATMLSPIRDPCNVPDCVDEAYAQDAVASDAFFDCWADAVRAFEDCVGQGACDGSCASLHEVCTLASGPADDAIKACSATCDL